MAFNKIMLGDIPIIDLTSDTVTSDKLLAGITAHRADGEIITGAIANNGTIIEVISAVAQSIAIPDGYHSGTGTVSIDPAEQAKIIPANIKSGISILGVQGNASDILLNPVTPNGINLTHYYMPKNNTNLYWSVTYESGTNTRSDEYVVQSGHSYLARFISPYGARCMTALSKESLVDGTSTIGNCIRVAPDGWQDYIFFTAPMDCYFIMYKDNTGNDNYQTECFEVTYVSS